MLFPFIPFLQCCHYFSGIMLDGFLSLSSSRLIGIYYTCTVGSNLYRKFIDVSSFSVLVNLCFVPFPLFYSFKIHVKSTYINISFLKTK